MAIPENVLRWRELVDANKGPYSTALLLALMHQLSRGDPDAANQFGARGLFLIHPDTAAAFDVEAEDLTTPVVSIQLAVSLLQDRWDKLRAAAVQQAFYDMTDEQLLQLTLPAYWWGPVPTLNAIAAGNGPAVADIWSAIDRGDAYREFANSILTTAAEFQKDLPSPAANGNDIATPQPVPTSRGLWVLAGLGAVGILVWLDRRRAKKKKRKKRRSKKKK